MFGPGTFIFGVLIPLVVVVLVAYGVWELVRSREATPSMAGGQGPAASGSARAILDERFARGEVDVDEYVRRRALLDGSIPSPPTDVAPTAAPVAPGPMAASAAPVPGAPDSMAADTGVMESAGSESAEPDAEPSGE